MPKAILSLLLLYKVQIAMILVCSYSWAEVNMSLEYQNNIMAGVCVSVQESEHV